MNDAEGDTIDDGMNEGAVRLHVGTQVVLLREVTSREGKVLQPRGAVGVIVHAPRDDSGGYRVRFMDHFEELISASELTTLAKFQTAEWSSLTASGDESLFHRVIFQCVIGSQAYGLQRDGSDIDRRGCYLPTAARHWSLYGVPEQIECYETQETYWEIEKLLVLALKANPNVLECLYSPIVEKVTPLGQELLSIRSIFLSKLVFQTYNGYVMSQFKKMQGDLRNHGSVRWKHVMHLIRLLLSGIDTLKHGFVPVRVEKFREQLLAIREGELSWDECERWRTSLHAEFTTAFERTSLPSQPDYEQANAFLIRCRQVAMEDELP